MRRLLLLFLISLPLMGAVPNVSTMTWSVYDTGNSANGGCFDTVTGSGHTDYSDSASPQVTFSAGNSNRLNAAQNSTTVTSDGTPFTLAMQGNCINLVAVNNCIAGTYLVTVFTNSSTVTVDRAPATAGACSVGTGRLGGALAFPTQATSSGAVGGNIVWVKATATYVISAQQVMNVVGTAGSPVQVIGYTATRGDNGHATLLGSTGLSTGIMRISGAFNVIANFTIGCGSFATSQGINIAAADATVRNVSINNCTSVGLDITGTSSRAAIYHVDVSGTTSAGAASIRSAATGGVTCYACSATGGATIGFLQTAVGPFVCISCVSANNSGASSNGFESSATSGLTLINATAYNNGKFGYQHNNGSGAGGDLVINSLFSTNGSGGVSSSATVWTTPGQTPVMMDYNAYKESTAYTNFPAGPNDVTLTQDPFISVGGLNFGLNTTAGGGASARQKGSVGVIGAFTGSAVGSTGYVDIGAIQSPPISGSASVQ